MNPFKSLADWFDNRTGYRQQLSEALYENIPGGARWRYVTGSMLVFAFATQMITGIFLWMAYSPSSQTAWESVYYIQNEMTGGWLLRGIHHFMAQAMIVLLPIHMLQVLIDKAYKAPREINYWLGVILMLLVLGLGLTGYLLPWDQKGFWATKVATNLMSLAPGGEYLQKLVVGGSNYGHHTLTRFFAMHAGVLPALMIFFLVLHIAMFRKHGITAHSSAKRPDQFFWPHQILKDGVACLLLLIVVMLAVIGFGNLGGLFTGNLPPTAELGAEMSAPAEPSEEYSAARPEWYFLFLFQLLKKFTSEFLGAIVIPGLIVALLFVMPLLGRWKVGHAFNLAAFVLLLAGAGYLTFEAMYQDNYYNLVDKQPEDEAAYERYKASRDYLQSSDLAHREYERLKELIEYKGMGKEGAAALARQDPEIQGPRLFVRHCASCHSYQGPNPGDINIAGPDPPNAGEDPNGAPNLYGFGSRDWLAGFFDPAKFGTAEYFGHTKHAGGTMSEVVAAVADLDEPGKKTLQQMIAALSAEANLPYQAEQEAKEQTVIAQGRQALATDFLGYDACTSCHSYRDEEVDDTVPSLTGYGSYDWLRGFIANPTAHYGMEDEDDDGNPIWRNDRMPAFAPHPDDPKKNLLPDHDIDMLVRFIRQDDLHLKAKSGSQHAAEQE